MGSTFGGLELGKRALQVQRQSLEVTGHNIANANTEGYSRQRVIQATTSPLNSYGTGAGQIGTGVKVASIKRVRNQFVDRQVMNGSSTKGRWEVIGEAMNRVESIFNEPSEKGLRGSMNEFWNSLQDLTEDPESTAIRSTVREDARMLIDTFNHLDEQLTGYQEEINYEIKSTVEEINSYGQRIADLNKQITKAEGMDQSANDLRDKRDLLVEELSKLTNIQVREDAESAIMISINGQKLVFKEDVTNLVVSKDDNKFYQVKWKNENKADFSDGKMKALFYVRDEGVEKYRKQLDIMAKNLVREFNDIHKQGYGLADKGMNSMTSEKQSNPTNPLGGKSGEFSIILNGKSVGDNIRVESGDSLDQIATKMNGVAGISANTVDKDGDGVNDTIEFKGANSSDILTLKHVDIGTGVNALEELGMRGTGSGREFFAGDSAGTIRLSNDVLGEIGLKNIATATKSGDTNGDGINDYIGDSNNVLKLARVGTSEITEDSSEMLGTTFEDYYNSNIGELGIESQRAQRMIKNNEILVGQLKQQRESISGVSLDEEMAKMIKFQHAYKAAAKVISTLDEMLGVLVTGLKR